MFAGNVSRTLAADTEQSYSLRKIAHTLANDTVVFHRSSDAFLYDFFTKRFAENSFFHFNTATWVSWAILLLFTALMATIIVGYRMNCKLKLLVALAASGNSPITHVTGQHITRVINLQTIRPSIEPLSDSMNFITDILNELRYVDIILWTILCIIILLFIVSVTIALKRALSRRTRLYLEIKQGTQAMQIRVMTLHDGMRFYRVKIPSTSITIEIKRYVVFAYITLSADEWHIKNTLTKERLEIPSIIWLTPYSAFKLQRMISMGEYTVRPLLIHNQEFNYLSNTQDAEHSS
jgi:hypothetical protein